ncbi:uncharacterized protein [Henckelia pumila]|uniref:uncharacterized protein n=1 Tax=Henckelia pumila TaxID=405737 RepID=UPI003C6E2F0F
MEWRDWYLDVILVPLGSFIFMSYHLWLWHRVRSQPFTTVIGRNTRSRRLWVAAMMKDNDKKNILAIQTLRNAIMGSTLMATTAILLCAGLAAFLSSTYSIKKPLNNTVHGAQGEYMLTMKFATMLLVFLSSFMSHSLSIRFMNHVSFLVNCPPEDSLGQTMTTKYVSELLERGFWLNMVGNRLFYAAVPLLSWISGPVLVFICYAVVIIVLYGLDLVFVEDRRVGGEIYGNDSRNFVAV